MDKATIENAFKKLKLNPQLIRAIDNLNWKAPTEIQLNAIPKILAGHDLIGIAQTGTGKTAAFGLPLLMKIKYAQGKDPRALVLAPTRELVIQIEKHFQSLAIETDLRIVAIYGGIGPKTQIEQINKGVDVLISTPGRFMDLYLKDHIVTKYIKFMVLDEADKMMDMGFMPQIRRILEVVPTKRQNLLFSATMEKKVERLTQEFLEFPLRIEATPSATPAHTVIQLLYHVPNFLGKIQLLEHFILTDDKKLCEVAEQNEDSETLSKMSKVLIFAKSKAAADNIYKFLHRKMIGGARVIHSNKGQNSRINAIKAFEEGEIRFLVSTDVAARGIDIAKVSHVINFDIPLIYEDYVHRIGRTGRAFNKGVAISFANKAEELYVEEIEKIIQQKIPLGEIPTGIIFDKTSKDEMRQIEFEIDKIKRKRDPNFKGAFHAKKSSNTFQSKQAAKNKKGKKTKNRKKH